MFAPSPSNAFLYKTFLYKTWWDLFSCPSSYFLMPSTSSSAKMMQRMWPFPILAWAGMLGARLALMLPHLEQYILIYLALLFIWVYIGAGGGYDSTTRVPNARQSSLWEEGISRLRGVFGPGPQPSAATTALSRYVPVVDLWAELPLLLGPRHPNVFIAGIAFAVVNTLREYARYRASLAPPPQA